MLSGDIGNLAMLPSKPPVYQLRIDGELKALKSADLDSMRKEAKVHSDMGKCVEIVDCTTGKVVKG